MTGVNKSEKIMTSTYSISNHLSWISTNRRTFTFSSKV